MNSNVLRVIQGSSYLECFDMDIKTLSQDLSVVRTKPQNLVKQKIINCIETRKNWLSFYFYIVLAFFKIEIERISRKPEWKILDLTTGDNQEPYERLCFLRQGCIFPMHEKKIPLLAKLLSQCPTCFIDIIQICII